MSTSDPDESCPQEASLEQGFFADFITMKKEIESFEFHGIEFAGRNSTYGHQTKRLAAFH